MRRTVLDFRKSATPALIGACAADGPTLFSYLNSAIERLVYAGGETGWRGGWYKTVFNLTQDDPYVTTGREIARIINFTVCDVPVRTQNEFYEFLEASIGPQPPSSCPQSSQPVVQALDRGFFPSMVDIPTDTNYKLRAYPKDPRDYGKRLLASGIDENSVVIRNTDGTHEVAGEYLTLADPFVDSSAIFSRLDGVQKDVTFRDVDLYAVNQDDLSETLLSTYAPGETVPSYRRYYLDDLPENCCCSSIGSIQVYGMAKLECLPVASDTDFLLIGNLPALEEECLAIHYGRMDNPKALQMSAIKHMLAIKLLNQELDHYFGRSSIAVSQPLWGTADLRRTGVSTMI